MDLFVVQRYAGDHETTHEDEQTKLNELFEKIQRNKEKQTKEGKKEIIEDTKSKQKKRHTPELDENNIETEISEENLEKPKKKKRKKELPLTAEGFTILGAENKSQQIKAQRVLPKWLSEPTVISTNLTKLKTKVSALKLLKPIFRKKLKANGVQYLFPVQEEVIPWLLKVNKHSSVVVPQDVCVSAPTGSGKTLAFALPIIQALSQYQVKRVRALVILPTQDLAFQVFKTFKTYCEGTSVDVSYITGKNPFPVEQKMLVVETEAFGFVSKTDIIICTAGRLVDHLKHTKGFDLKDLEYLVIDEADRVLDNVQHDWLYHLEDHIKDIENSSTRITNLFNMRSKRAPQKLLFSATLSQDPEKLEKLSLFQPKLFTSVVESDNPTEKKLKITSETFIGKYTTPKELTEKYIVCSLDIKPLVLYKYIKTEKLTKTLIFTNSINDAHKLCILLKKLFGNELTIVEMSSQSDTKDRKDLIGEFSKGNIDLIVCTDALARGIDLPGVQCVISYALPKHLKTYIHRVGRTARAGALGTAVSLIQTSQLAPFQNLLRQADKNNVEQVSVETSDLESLSETYSEALEELKKVIDKEEMETLRKIKKIKQLESGRLKGNLKSSK